MAHASGPLILALRETAARLLREEVTYRWSSFGHCNCGHLAQTITGLDPAEIQRRAMRREGDWGSQARDSASRRFPELDHLDQPALGEGAWEPENVGACLVTGAPLDEVLGQMYELGLSPEDVGHLERLSDPEVRRRLGTATQYFPHHHRQNVVAYLQAWAELLEERLGATAQGSEQILEAAE
jgi:hypothetical protein